MSEDFRTNFLVLVGLGLAFAQIVFECSEILMFLPPPLDRTQFPLSEGSVASIKSHCK